MLHIRLDNSPGAPPLHRQIAEQIRFQIDQGELGAGARLPATRELARQLGIARGTVVLAYEELCAMGACESRVGSGTIVKKQPSSPMPERQVRSLITPDEPVNLDPGQISLLPSIADTEHLPISELRRGFDRVLRFPAHLRSFGESAGDPELRRLICERILLRRGVKAEPDEVLIVPGTQYGAVLLALTLRTSRRRLHFGVPGYLDMARNFARFGFELKSHPVDGEGIDLNGWEPGPDDVLYVMPEHHFPQCVTLGDARREGIEKKIKESRLLVIEDDYDSEYYYDRRPKPAIKAGQERDGVIYLGTFSKMLFNNLRLGYIVAEPAFIRELATLHWSLSRGTSGLLQRWAAELLKEGTLERHVQRMRTVYRRKRDRIAGILRRDFPEWSFAEPRGGLQFFIDAGSADAASSIISACRSKRLKLAHPSNYVEAGEPDQQFVVLGFGSAPLNQIEEALAELRLALSAA